MALQDNNEERDPSDIMMLPAAVAVVCVIPSEYIFKFDCFNAFRLSFHAASLIVARTAGNANALKCR
jgi:hypothetical protein